MKVLNSNEANAVIALTAQELRDIKSAVYFAKKRAELTKFKSLADRLEEIYNQL